MLFSRGRNTEQCEGNRYPAFPTRHEGTPAPSYPVGTLVQYVRIGMMPKADKACALSLHCCSTSASSTGVRYNEGIGS